MTTAIDNRAEHIVELRKLLKPGDTVYCVLRRVSKSGMSRIIDFFVIRKNELQRIAMPMANILDLKWSKDHDGLRVDGCGMDMGFHCVYSLSRALFPNGFKVKGRGRNGDTSGEDRDGGYALNHRWL